MVVIDEILGNVFPAPQVGADAQQQAIDSDDERQEALEARNAVCGSIRIGRTGKKEVFELLFEKLT